MAMTFPTFQAPSLYFDNAATTPIAPEVSAVLREMEAIAWANSGSLHHYGKQAAESSESARQQMATLLGASSPECITWTSGGTEALNMVVLGLAYAELNKSTNAPLKKHLVSTPIEHAALRRPIQMLQENHGFEVTWLPVTKEGLVNPADVETALRPDTLLVAVGHANNEIGTLQPIESIGRIARAAGVPFLSDTVQTVGKLRFSLDTLPVDYIVGSAHKFYGPRGVGFLYQHPQAPKLLPIYRGGSQESGERPGTVNAVGVLGMAKALELCMAHPEQEAERLHALIRRLRSGVEAACGEHARFIRWNSPLEESKRLPGLINLSLPALEGEGLVLRLSLEGLAASSGSACNSKSVLPSAVLLALGVEEAYAKASLRLSCGRYTTENDVDIAISSLARLVTKAAKMREKQRSLTA